MIKKVDVIAFAAHPDDAELGCGGALALLAQQGAVTGIIDLTRGELGTRGTPDLREREAKEAAAILGAVHRENIGLRDGFFENNEGSRLAVVEVIRRLKPTIVLANAITDRHPDHCRAAELVRDACFLAGLLRISTQDKAGNLQKPYRPLRILHYIQDTYTTPSFILDTSGVWELKLQAIRAYKSQFYNPESTEPSTYISSPDFLLNIDARGREYGRAIGCEYGEGFYSATPIKINSLLGLI